LIQINNNTNNSKCNSNKCRFLNNRHLHLLPQVCQQVASKWEVNLKLLFQKVSLP
jgi:hypothetical protein